jgi:hypothetical protein
VDPTANLKEQREISARILYAEDNTPESIMNDAARLAELVDALDTWIAGGGFLPMRWKH